uniref:Uncharacterized protein n=1 Tax=Nelumbo nucifera TaxID=4432 RepID=A0A822XTX4_NELNU|nr:TPA_asm: hypothetical protein HUJ06_025293 [Nelumbo nucifera]
MSMNQRKFPLTVNSNVDLIIFGAMRSSYTGSFGAICLFQSLSCLGIVGGISRNLGSVEEVELNALL